MTAGSGGAVERHLSEEELSDLVDAQGPPEALAHLSGCPSCQAELDRWRSTSSRLAAPVFPPEGQREEAVAAAMARAGIGGTGAGGRGSAGRRPRWPIGLAAAAGVVVAAGVGLSQLHGSSRVSSKASSGTAAAPAGGAAAAGAGRYAVQGGGVPDLGSLDSTASLVAAVDKALPHPGPTQSTGAVAGGTAAASGAAGTTPGAGGSPVASGPAQPSGASPVAGAGSQGAAASSVPATPPGSCLLPVGLFAAGSQPRLLMEATARYRGVPAEVFVLDLAGGRRAVVVATHGCAVLAQAAL